MLESTPHPYYSFALPLSFGLESDSESTQVINADGEHLFTFAGDPHQRGAQEVINAVHVKPELVSLLYRAHRVLASHEGALQRLGRWDDEEQDLLEALQAMEKRLQDDRVNEQAL